MKDMETRPQIVRAAPAVEEESKKRRRSLVESTTQLQRHVRRRSSRLRDDSILRSGESQPTSSGARIVILQRELEQLQADLSSTKLELEHQRSVNVYLLAQKSRVEAELAQVTGARNAQAAELLSLRADLANRTLVDRTSDARDEELATLKAFLSKTDDFSGAQILQSVQDLNTEIVQLAAAVSEEFPLSRRGPSSWTPAQAEVIQNALGDGMLGLLRDRDHEEDPSLVQLAVQAWEVRCCQDILDAFCVGLTPEVDRFLCALFEEMQTSESQATTSRWRALTHLHARNLMIRFASASSETPPPSYASTSSSCMSVMPVVSRAAAAYPTPESSNNNTPASQMLALPSMPLALAVPTTPTAHANLDGLQAILALSGCTDERGTSVGLLAERFGDAVARIGEAAEELARAVREGVSSAWFAVRVAPPAHSFNVTDMDNTYVGFGNETADVLCTVGLGLEVVSRTETTPDEIQPGTGLQRMLLLKPQVVLESVQELL
ncbi:hypothetical protein K488DRAFT_84197 [Vararia minispora EC-137]|uniref:Uncharacterized protein n=1 Tax=Vararia minispora EC-137 TaxID=1314806 RepID=A0ACB8QRT6_9AGAM|nr:hypothetical protein K488DRAFT_84197 [Vararia minispora EC-137]